MQELNGMHIHKNYREMKFLKIILMNYIYYIFCK